MKFKQPIKNLPIALFLLILPSVSFATQTGSFAWESVLNKITKSLTGPVAYAVAIIAIVVSGFLMAFADLQGGAKRFVQAACGLSTAFFAASIVTGFLNFSGAVI